MKATSLIFTLIFLSVSAFGQTQVFKNYDFNKGGYYILGTFAESDRNTLRDSLGEFYTDNITILNQFKKEWTFKIPGKRYACGYHYMIDVCRNGQILETLYLNLNCEEISTEYDWFYFNQNKLRQFYGKLKKPISKKQTFNTIEEARVYWYKILKDTNLIMTPKPLWIEYEGSFRFTYKCKEGTKDCLKNEKKIIKSIQSEIKKKYPGEKFLLENVGGSISEIYFKINCNKSLSDIFNLYHRDEIFDKWEPFQLYLKTYWKIDNN